MNRVTRRICDWAEEYKAALLLIGIILALGLMIGPTPHSPADAVNAVNRVYSLDAQPIACQPQRKPPTR